MTEVFLKVIRMSLSAGWLVLAIVGLRLILRKAPRWIHVLLWGMVAVRLMFPFSIESRLSLIPDWKIGGQSVVSFSQAAATGQILDTDGTVLVEKDLPSDTNGHGQILDAEGNVILQKPLDTSPDAAAPKTGDPFRVLSWVWCMGCFLMLGYALVSYVRLRHRVRTSVQMYAGVRRSEYIDSPFVLGLFRPIVYLPYGIDERDMDHVIAHEQAHMERKDHWWKPLGFLLLAVHWFNPLIWVAYVLLCRDIELACDERVIADLDSVQRAEYTQALVNCSVSRRSVAACPLAFGEVGVKARVRSIMNYRKCAFWIVVTALAACVAVAVCFLTDPKALPVYAISGDVHTVVISHQSPNGEASAATITDRSVIRDVLSHLESLEIEDYSRPLSPERMELTFFNGNGDPQKWTVSYYEAEGEIVTCGSPFGIGNKRVINGLDYTWLVDLFDNARTGMVPTDTNCTGLGAGALLLPLDGEIYRYMLAEHDPEGVTADALLFSFQEIDMGESVRKEVYSLKEFPDRSRVLLISAKNGPWLCEYAPPQRCSDTALTDAVDAGFVVMEDGLAIHGQDIWHDFYRKTQQGKAASVTVAHYHTLNPEQCDSVYYQIFRQDYPCLYVHELRYDGKQFTLINGSGESETYEYLMKYRDNPKNAFSSLVPQDRDHYVLTHDDRYTYDELWMSVASSAYGAYIDHYTIYSECKE